MASIFGSLFGVGQEKQQQPGAGVISQELPKAIAPYYEKLLKEAEGLYKQKMEAGAPTYEGKTIAGFTPEQEQLFTGLQSLQGTQAPKFAEAEALTRGTAEKITPDEVQEYMNPYQQAVVDIEKREAQKQYESTVVPQLAAQAAATGGFGGSRQAILEGMASEANQRLLGDIQAKGSAQAYQDAMSNIAAQRQREGAAGAQLATMAPAGFQAQAQELGAIGKVGDVKQQQAQLALDEAYKQYLQEQQFPSEALKEYQSYVQSFPNIPTQITRQPVEKGPGLAQQLLGLGTAAVGTYGAFGGFSPGGFMGMKQAETGGGIAGLPVVYAKKGTSDKIINEATKDFNYFRDVPFGRILKGTGKGLKDTAIYTATLPYRIAGEATAGLERFGVRPLAKFFAGKDPGPIFESEFAEMYPDRTLIYRDIEDEKKGLASVVPDSAGAGEFGTGEYTGATKEDLGIGTGTTQTTSDQEMQIGLGDVEANISKVPTEEEYQAKKSQEGAPPPPAETAQSKENRIATEVEALMGKDDQGSVAKTLKGDLDTLYKNQLGKYEMPEDVKKGFEKVRGGISEEGAAIDTDIAESEAETKKELFTPLIALGKSIAEGKTSISGAIADAAQQAVDIRVKGKARTKALKKERREIERTLDKFELDLAQYTEEKVTKREQEIFNRATKKQAMGLEISKLEEQIANRHLNAWKAVTANIVAERNAESSRISALAQKTAAETPKGMKYPKFEPANKTEIETSTNFVKGLYSNQLKNAGNVKQEGSYSNTLYKNINSVLDSQNIPRLSPRDYLATVQDLKNNTFFNQRFASYFKAKQEEANQIRASGGNASNPSQEAVFMEFAPAFLMQNPKMLDTDFLNRIKY